MQACWQAILAYICWTIALGQIHQLQPSLKSRYIPRNTTMMRGWTRESETLLNLSLTGRNINLITTHDIGSSWTISKQVAPDWKRIWHDLLKRQPQKVCKKPGRKLKAPQGTQRWELSSTAPSTLGHKSTENQTSLPPLLMKQPAIPPAKYPCYGLDYCVEEKFSLWAIQN